LALHDRIEITLRRKRGIEIECSDPAIPAGPENLIARAYELWRAERKFAGGAVVRLQKRIPVGGGLGGGSSDAAAALLGLERLTGDALDPGQRFRLAAQLGSDVPLFLMGGAVLGCGRGEEVYPLADLPPRKCLVAHPGFGISTAWAYREVTPQSRACRGGFTQPFLGWRDKPGATLEASRKLTSRRENPKVNTFGVWSQFPFNRWGPAENDFERVVFAKWPELGKLKRQFIQAGAETASLTGSGSSIYALFGSLRQMTKAAGRVPAGWAVVRTRTLTRREYQRLIFR
ncbi:MAG: 4-(cytidine 5'-diphospho)-2-C-methyl-D-erythritol kinase, partial [Terriglobia bacterium]